MKRRRVLCGLIKGVLCGAYAICALISILATTTYMINPDLVKPLDKITSGRISSASAVVKQNGGITLFGKNVDRSIRNKSDDTRVLDNGYIYTLLYYGIITLVLFAIVFAVYNRTSIVKDGGQTALVLAIYAVSGIAERFMIEIAANVFLLKYSELIYDNYPKKVAEC